MQKIRKRCYRVLFAGVFLAVSQPSALLAQSASQGSAQTSASLQPAGSAAQSEAREAIEAIRQEMTASRREYEARMAALEQRLAALETATPAPAGVAVATQQAVTADTAAPAAASGSAVAATTAAQTGADASGSRASAAVATPSAVGVGSALGGALVAVQGSSAHSAAQGGDAQAAVQDHTSVPAAQGSAPALVAQSGDAPSATASATADTAPTLEQRISALEQGQADNQLAMERFNEPDFIERILPKNFTFAGYLRAGYGINQYGGGQGKVASPDGLGSDIGPGRLGNEPDTYGDLTFRYRMPKDLVNDLDVAIQTTFSFRYNGMKNNYTNQHQSGVDLMFREAFVSVGNFLPDSPETRFWAGQRWYYRQDVHMYDFYYLDTSGYGGGVENIKLGPGRFAAAWLGGTNDTALVDNRYSLTKQVLDFRWSELPSFADGKGTLWISPQYVNGGSGGVTIPDKALGLAVGWIQENAFEQGVNKFSVQYGFGGAYGFGTTVPLADPATGRDKDWLKHAQTVQLTNNFVWLVNERFSLNWAIIGQWDDMGYTWVDPVTGDSGPGSSRFFVTSAVRPLYMITEHLGVESEIAAEWASRDRFTPGDKDTALGKLVLSGVIRPNGDVMARPEIRLYGGYYYWGGSMPSNYSVNGSKPDAVGTWVFGVQAEMWW